MAHVEIKLGGILKERGLGKYEFAEKAGVRPQVISNLTNNNIERLSLDHIAKIMEALEIEDFNKLLKLNK